MQITYFLDDSGDDGLSILVDVPPVVEGVRVEGFSPDAAPRRSKAGRAASCQYSIDGALRYVRGVSGGEPAKWAATPVLRVFPEAGRQMNAYYDRGALRFFYAAGRDGRTVYTSDVPDCVTHELGHAVLDALRPDLWDVGSPEAWAFHEAFADMHAVIWALGQERLVALALEQTGGDLSKSNVISRVGESMARVIHGMAPEKSDGECLRDLTVPFQYASPSAVPKAGPPSVLTSQPHSFGRVFTGAWYAMLVELYNFHKRGSPGPVAVAAARDEAADILLKGARNAPKTVRFFESVASVMYASAGPRAGIVAGAFLSRGVLTPAASVLSVPDPQVYSCPQARRKTLRLADHIVRASSGSHPLDGLEVEIPSDLSDHVDAELVDATALCLDMIDRDGLLGRMWVAADGALKRHHICGAKHAGCTG